MTEVIPGRADPGQHRPLQGPAISWEDYFFAGYLSFIQEGTSNMETVANTPHFEAAPLTFSVWQELWDGNIQDHPDQGPATLFHGVPARKDHTRVQTRPSWLESVIARSRQSRPGAGRTNTDWTLSSTMHTRIPIT